MPRFPRVVVVLLTAVLACSEPQVARVTLSDSAGVTVVENAVHSAVVPWSGPRRKRFGSAGSRVPTR